MRNTIRRLVAASALGIWLLTIAWSVPAMAQTTILQRETIAGGGDIRTGQLRLHSVIGQHTAGVSLTQGAYRLSSGFLWPRSMANQADPTPQPEPEPNPGHILHLPALQRQ
jgi:hypothetical protein